MESKQNCEQEINGATAPEKTKKSKKWLIFVSIAVLLCGAAIAAVLILKAPSAGNTATEQTTHPAGEQESQKGPLVVYREAVQQRIEYNTDGTTRTSQENRVITVYNDAGEPVNNISYCPSTGVGSVQETRDGENLISVTFYTTNGEWKGCRSFSYDDKDRVISYADCDKDGNINWHYKYSYDTAGNITSQISYDKKDNITAKYEYGYDAAGNMISETKYDKTEITSRLEYRYDDAGNMISRIVYNKNGNITNQIEQTFNADGNLLSRIEHDKVNKITYKTEYSYNADGNKISQISYDKNGDIANTYKWEYDYDNAGNKISESKYNKNDKLIGKIEWDTAGNMIAEIEYGGDGVIVCKYGYSYDGQGNMISKTKYDKNGNITSKEKYGYDDAGNEIYYGYYSGGIMRRERTIETKNDSRIETEKQYNESGKVSIMTTTTATHPVTYQK